MTKFETKRDALRASGEPCCDKKTHKKKECGNAQCRRRLKASKDVKKSLLVLLFDKPKFILSTAFIRVEYFLIFPDSVFA